LMTWDVRTASQKWLINLCQSVEKKEGMIGGLVEGNRVIKISEKIAVKYGFGVTATEAATQDFAYRNIDPSIARVPKVYRFFQDESDVSCIRGYLFMEYVPGRNLKDLDLDIHKDIVPRVADVIAHLGRIPGGHVPGPVGGGKPQGYLWGDYGTKAVFHSVADMNAWLNKRLVLRNESIDLTPYPLVLCHMDLCRRNMILEEDNKSIWLVDWGHAGLFPRFFEVATISCLNPYDAPYEEDLLRTTEKRIGLTEVEKGLIKLMQIARAASLRYLL
jgi:aminoglycoside phosphotransferase (APT) family kinase protein